MILRRATLDGAAAIAPLLGELGYPSSVEETRERLEKLLGDSAPRRSDGATRTPSTRPAGTGTPRGGSART